MKMKKLSAISLILIFAIFLTSCGKEENKEVQGKVQSSGGLLLQMRAADSLNPLLAKDVTVQEALWLCYEPLFKINGKISPSGVLATGYKILEDSKGVIVSLKENVLWHDGKKFGAGDVIFTIDYIRQNQDSPYNFCVKYIESVSAIDEHTVRINLTRPYAQIAYSLYFPIIPSHIESLDETIVGTGGYKMVDYTSASVINLKRFESWNGGTAKCESAVISIVRDDNTATSVFNKGVINAITNSSFDLSNYALKKNMKAAQYPSSKYVFMAYNQNRPQFLSSAVRSAISAAINREEIVSECFGGYGVAANIPIHPLCDAAKVSPTLTQYSIDNAHELLFFEGHTLNTQTGMLEDDNHQPLGFTLLVNKENDAMMSCAQLVLRQLARAGISVQIDEKDYEEYLNTVNSGFYDAYLGTTSLGNMFDYEFLFTETGGLNTYGYKNEYMDLALSAIANAPTKDSLENAALNFEEIFEREQPVCGILYLTDVLITTDSAKASFSPCMNMPYLSKN